MTELSQFIAIGLMGAATRSSNRMMATPIRSACRTIPI
jgi:hypothetical protein